VSSLTLLAFIALVATVVREGIACKTMKLEQTLWPPSFRAAILLEDGSASFSFQQSLLGVPCLALSPQGGVVGRLRKYCRHSVSCRLEN